MSRLALPLVAAVALSACATDQVTLLENEDGQGGALAVLSSQGAETVIDSPNMRASLRDGGAKVRPAGGTDRAYADLFATLPPAAKMFAITFPTGESRIFVGQRKIIDQIQAELAARPGAQIEVAGFTDSVGDEASNDRLSAQRAESVVRELREYGFPVDPGDAIGRGEDEARAALGDNVPDETYRRVFVIVR